VPKDKMSTQNVLEMGGERRGITKEVLQFTEWAKTVPEAQPMTAKASQE